ncbi:MAG: ATP-dependent DNA helicase RecG [Gammaproteobacteria bacterium]|nr:ATP-dependent DNA helicase RecG [Gammaproteobacteria bacterium]
MLERVLSDVKGIGPASAVKLESLGLVTVLDALFHLPLRYQDRSTLCPIGSVQIGAEQRISGQITNHRLHLGKKRSLLIDVDDGSSKLTLRFFYFAKAMREKLKVGEYIDCFGEVRRGPQSLEMVHPEWKIIDGPATQRQREPLTPIYPACEGVSQSLLLKCIGAALDTLAKQPPTDYLNHSSLLKGLPSLAEALATVHNPPMGTDLNSLKEGEHPAIKRLIVEELVAHKLALWWAKQQAKKAAAPTLSTNGNLRRKLLAELGFTLTNAQKRVLGEIDDDLATSHPMTRLVQGDVGSGKTAVAAAAACTSLENGWQVALMAPTEILAEQHFKNLSRWFEPLGIQTEWLAGKLTPAQRREPMARIANGDAQLIIGTHALFQSSVQFKQLGLVIIDEQHRFGVEQRRTLVDKNAHLGVEPHQLAMTATPIPRTLAMTAYADIDVSIIDELPPGRTPVKTVALPNDRRQDIIARMDTAMQEGRQVYWVCTLIDESEAIQAESATLIWQQLVESLPTHKIGLVHGRMKSAEKDAVMSAFKAGEFSCLVATTVIEVGVDVPNASLMIIDNAERLGLSQLHQLRGRVGRGNTASSCVLLYQPPLGDYSRQRLDALRQSNDGFWIAERDLELRGPGEILGVKQTGLATLRVASIVRDRILIPQVDDTARALWSTDGKAVKGLIKRWVGEAALSFSRV